MLTTGVDGVCNSYKMSTRGIVMPPRESLEASAEPNGSHLTWPQRLLALRQLTRIEKPIATTLYAFLGAYLAGPIETLWSRPVLTAAFVVYCVTTFGFIINDYCDVKVDSIGKPYRPIPSGRIMRRTAGRLAWGIAAVGLAASLTLGAGAALFALVAVVLSAAYSFSLKSTVLLGNASVALLVAAVLFYGAMVAGDPLAAPVLAAALITVPYIVGQEALFNLEDIDEDGDAGLSTTATCLGKARTTALIQITMGSFFIVAIAVWLLLPAPDMYLLLMSVLVLWPTAIVIFNLRRPTPEAAVTRAVKLSRLIWVTSFVPLAMLK